MVTDSTEDVSRWPRVLEVSVPLGRRHGRPCPPRQAAFCPLSAACFFFPFLALETQGLAWWPLRYIC